MIEFLIANWALFLIVCLIGYMSGITLQLINMKNLATEGLDKIGGILTRFGFVALCLIIGSASGMALVVSIILNAIEYFS